jgi:hypothetical protein
MLLASCQTTPVQQLSYSETKTLAKQLHQRCADQGIPMGHAEFDACMQQEVSREAYTHHANQQRQQHARMALAAGLAGAGAGMQTNAATYRPVNCTSTLTGTWVGRPNAVRTRCY